MRLTGDQTKRCSRNPAPQQHLLRSVSHICAGDVHTQEKNFQCSECGKAFQLSGNVNKHHTQEKEFKCKRCLKSFARKSSLLSHMGCHSRVKPYKCFCGKLFKHNITLQSHGRKHSGEKLRCPNKGCEKKYLYRSSLMIHLRRSCAFQQ